MSTTKYISGLFLYISLATSKRVQRLVLDTRTAQVCIQCMWHTHRVQDYNIYLQCMILGTTPEYMYNVRLTHNIHA